MHEHVVLGALQLLVCQHACLPRFLRQVVAAGNSYESACLMSPASSPWVGGVRMHACAKLQSWADVQCQPPPHALVDVDKPAPSILAALPCMQVISVAASDDQDRRWAQSNW